MGKVTLSTILKEGRRLGLQDALEDLAYQTTRDTRRGRMHLSTGLGTRCGQDFTYQSEKVDLERVKDRRNRCVACVQRLSEPPPRLRKDPSWEVLNVIGYLLASAETVERLRRELQAGTGVEEAAETHQELNQVRVDLRDGHHPPGALGELTGHAAAETRRLQEELGEHLSRPEVKEALTRSARARSGSTREEEDVLVGWSRSLETMLHTGAYPPTVRQVLLAWEPERHSGRATSVVVPASVAEWVVHLSAESQGYRGEAQSAPAPRDPRTRETALGLWTPRTKGTLSDLATAVSAAEALHQERRSA